MSRPIPKQIRLKSATLDLIPRLTEYITYFDNLQGPTLSSEVRRNMAISLANFIEKSTVKFINGQVEHKGDIRDRDLAKEMQQEIIDMFWYKEAMLNWPSKPAK